MGKRRDYELKVELGHKSTPLPKKLPNGYTHQWTVYVKGVNDAKIEHCVQRVIFRLHESFADYVREVTSPPYEVEETGYAGFIIPVEIYFKNREKPNSVTFDLDLNLLTGKPHSNSITHRITLKQVNKEFEKCLIKSGAHLLSGKSRSDRSNNSPAPSLQLPLQLPPQVRELKSSSSSSILPYRSNGPPVAEKPKSNRSSSPLAPPPPSKKHKSSSLISAKSSSQVQAEKSKGGRGSSPPPKKQKSSLIPSKDMNEQALIDVFGAPLVYNKHKQSLLSSSSNNNNHQSNHHHSKSMASTGSSSSSSVSSSSTAIAATKTTTTTVNNNNTSTTTSNYNANTTTAIPSTSSNNHNHHHNSNNHKSHHNSSNHKSHHETSNHKSHNDTSNHKSHNDTNGEVSQIQNGRHGSRDLKSIHNKILSLSDCDRLQKIVDIISQAGEWFNVTSEKFQFDLGRMHKKTIGEIERCLQS